MAQKLKPEHKELYDRIMNTPVPKKRETEHATHSSTKPAVPQTPPDKKDDAFLSSLPGKTVSSSSVKSFSFHGKVKEAKHDPKEHAEEKTASTQSKQPASKSIVIMAIIGLVIAWGLFWMIMFDFI